MSTANSASISVAHGSSADDAGSAAHPAAPLADSLRIEPLTGLPARQTFGTLVPQPSPSFVVTPAVEAITQRALGYLDCGYAVHLAGPAGTGKTTLAFHVAAQLGRPVTLIHGNDEFGASDLVGKEGGYRKSTLVDNYVRSVLKTEESVQVHWQDNRLTTACEHGHTLIYDEFNRSRPEANNALLSILEEGLLNLPKGGGADNYLRVHDNFRAIFTSNPEEYAGGHKTQDALLDRMVTIQIDHYDQSTETDITSSKSNLPAEDSRVIVELANLLREMGSGHRPTIRACIALARVLSHRGVAVNVDDPFFKAAAWDIFGAQLRDAMGHNTRPGPDDLMGIVRDIQTGRISAAASPAKPRKSMRPAA